MSPPLQAHAREQQLMQQCDEYKASCATLSRDRDAAAQQMQEMQERLVSIQQQVIRPFRRWTILCESASGKQKTMLAGQRSSRGLCRWSRRGERCTQAQRPRPAGAALCLFPRPACVIWCWFVCAGVLVTVARTGGSGARGAAGPRRACLHVIDAGRSAPPFLQSAPPSTQRTPRIACDRHQYQQGCAGEGAEGGLVKGRQ